MTSLNLTFQGAQVLDPDAGLTSRDLSIAGGVICDDPQARHVDLPGYIVLPGMVDLHGDGFERHVAPRRGAMTQMAEGIIAAEAEFAANGLTTAYLAQFWSWEGGLRGEDFAAQVMTAIEQARPLVATDLRKQLRFETHQLDDYEALQDRLGEWDVDYVVFNDHLPHKRLSEGRKPPRMTGQALKARRNPDDHLALMQRLHGYSDRVPAALDALCPMLAARGIKMGSHDDASAETRGAWHNRGAHIAEFPETLIAAESAKAAGDAVIMGAPNVVRGGSHNGNVSAIELVAMGLVDALASDYHYPSLRRAALFLANSGVTSFEAAWDLVSRGPARVMGLTDRGTLTTGLRADVVILDAQTQRIGATIAGGVVSYMNGAVARRFFG